LFLVLFFIEPKVGEGEDEETAEKVIDENLIPESVVLLQGTDEFLKQRVKELPEERVANTHYNEEGMNRRLAEFKKNNDATTGESILADFFKERFIEPLVINVTNPSNDSFDNLRTFIERVRIFFNQSDLKDCIIF